MRSGYCLKSYNLDPEIEHLIQQTIEQMEPKYSQLISLKGADFTPDMKKCAIIGQPDVCGYGWRLYVLDIDHTNKRVTKCDIYKPTSIGVGSSGISYKCYPNVAAINKEGDIFACIGEEEWATDCWTLYLHVWQEGEEISHAIGKGYSKEAKGYPKEILIDDENIILNYSEETSEKIPTNFFINKEKLKKRRKLKSEI